mmetsp:Transcript_71548/g.152917  ORF Transcript_71548/g.152917 Transcript_71548/m.152917 type:complete len:245 (+) Transcript_71548:1508-2242(+)
MDHFGFRNIRLMTLHLIASFMAFSRLAAHEGSVVKLHGVLHALHCEPREDDHVHSRAEDKRDGEDFQRNKHLLRETSGATRHRQRQPEGRDARQGSAEFLPEAVNKARPLGQVLCRERMAYECGQGLVEKVVGVRNIRGAGGVHGTQQGARCHVRPCDVAFAIDASNFRGSRLLQAHAQEHRQEGGEEKQKQRVGKHWHKDECPQAHVADIRPNDLPAFDVGDDTRRMPCLDSQPRRATVPDVR